MASARHLVRVTLVGIILYTAIDITRYVIEDSHTWQELLGQIGVDIGKAIIASGVGYAGAAAAVGIGALTTVVLSPVYVVVIGVAVGFGTGALLNYIDRELAITDTVKAQMAQIDSLLDLLPAIPSSFTTKQQQKLIARAQGRRNRPL